MLSGEMRGKRGVASRQHLSTEKPPHTRKCPSYYSLSHSSELAFSLSERSSSENRTQVWSLRLNIFGAKLKLGVLWLSHLAPTLTQLLLPRLPPF